MFPVDLLARNDDLSGLISFCVFAGIVVFVILAKVISSVSPEAMARKIREMQGLRGDVAPVRKPIPASFEEPVYAQLVSEPLATAPKKKRKKKRFVRPEEDGVPKRLVADVRAQKTAPAAVAAEGMPSLRQSVIMAELLSPPLSLRRGRRGLLRSAPWIR
ncbi:MAG: hypothetical protein AAB434_08010 [Planctomycetota bacterium]